MQGLPAKKAVFDALIQRGSEHVHVHFDPRFDNVLVPAHLARQHQVVLAVGYNFTNPPILNLTVDDLGIYGIFSFKGVPEQCFIPWQRVFALVGTDGKGMVYQADIPDEVKNAIQRDQELRGNVENTEAGEEPRVAVVKARKNGQPLRYVRQGNVFHVDFKSHGASFSPEPSSPSPLAG